MGQDLEQLVRKLLERVDNGLPDQELYLKVNQHDGEIRGLKESLTDFQKTVSKSFETSNEALVRLGTDLNTKISSANVFTGEKLDKIEKRLAEESQERVRSKVIPPQLYISLVLLSFAAIAGATAYVSMLVSPIKETLNKVEQRIQYVEQSSKDLSVQSAELRSRLDNLNP